MADALEDLVAVALSKVWKAEIDPCCPVGGEFGKEWQIEAVGGQPEAVQEEDGHGNVVNVRFARKAEVAMEAEVPISSGVKQEGGDEKEDVGCHCAGGSSTEAVSTSQRVVNWEAVRFLFNSVQASLKFQR